jgi:hypothetical protein
MIRVMSFCFSIAFVLVTAVADAQDQQADVQSRLRLLEDRFERFRRNSKRCVGR